MGSKTVLVGLPSSCRLQWVFLVEVECFLDVEVGFLVEIDFFVGDTGGGVGFLVVEVGFFVVVTGGNGVGSSTVLDGLPNS